jgi:hypothetical protein
LYLIGSTYALAQADTEVKAEVAGLINRIIDVNTFEVCLGGEISPIGANLLTGANVESVILDTYTGTVVSGGFGINFGSTDMIRVFFPVSSSQTVTKINLLIRTDAVAKTGSIYLELYQSSIAEVPTGPVLGTSQSISLVGQPLNTYKLFEFTFSTPVSLTSGNYFFMLKETGVPSSAFFIPYEPNFNANTFAQNYNLEISADWYPTNKSVDALFQIVALTPPSTLTPGEVYYLSAASAGKLTTSAPSVVGQISKPVGIARTSTALDFFNMRGNSVGGSNVYTQITLANNATTTIQNAAAYDSVELAGWIYINATVKYRFHFKAQVTKKGDGTDYLVSFQTSGDTPPSGFNITVTTAGLVQVVMPSVAGFSSALAQFSLNGPAVGASLPLTIDSSNVSFGTIRAKDSNGIAFQSSSSTSIASLTNAGYLLTPNIPAFYAWQTGGVFSTLTGAFGTIAPKFGNTRLNVNNCYDTSNGRFTAPVNGIYEFHFGITHRWSTGAGNLEPTFYLNGSNISPRGCGYSTVTAVNDHDFVHVHMMLSLTAGQYVQCGIHACAAGTDYYYGENLAYFSGKLIG